MDGVSHSCAAEALQRGGGLGAASALAHAAAGGDVVMGGNAARREHSVDSGAEGIPIGTRLCQVCAPVLRDVEKPSKTAAWSRHALCPEKVCLFEPVDSWVHRPLLDAQKSAGYHGEMLRERVAMLAPFAQGIKHKQIEGSLEEWGV